MTESPTVAEMITCHKAQRDIVADHFREHPLAVIFKEAFKALVGDNYRSRVSDCVTQLGMHIELVPQYREYINKKGKVKRVRLIGAYRYLNYDPIPASHEASGQRRLSL